MAISRVIKQPSEAFWIGIDFTNLYESTTSIEPASVQVTIYESDYVTVAPVDELVISGGPETLGRVVTLKISGGDAGKRYVISILATGDDGKQDVFEHDVIVSVTNKSP